MKTTVGEIYIYQVPFVDNPKKSKPRPVLIISEPNSKGDIIVLAGTSKEVNWNTEESLMFTPNDIDDCLLSDNTVFPISKQVLISSSRLKIKVGLLNTISLKKVLKSLSLTQTKNYYNTIHKPQQDKKFIEGETLLT